MSSIRETKIYSPNSRIYVSLRQDGSDYIVKAGLQDHGKFPQKVLEEFLDDHDYLGISLHDYGLSFSAHPKDLDNMILFAKLNILTEKIG